MIKLHRDERADELAGAFLDGDRNLRAVAAEAVLIRCAVLAKGGRGKREEQVKEAEENWKTRKREPDYWAHDEAALLGAQANSGKRRADLKIGHYTVR